MTTRVLERRVRVLPLHRFVEGEGGASAGCVEGLTKGFPKTVKEVHDALVG